MRTGWKSHIALRAASAVLVLTGVLAACGDDGAGSSPGDTGGGDVGRGYGLGGAGEETSEAEATEGAGGGTGTTAGPLTVAETDLGQILVDAAGMTLYVFTDDSPGTSTCEGACLDLWPPVPGEAEAGEGVDADLLGTLERSDGSVQASYADRPLYSFAQDAEPGDTTGQGFNDVWFVVDADGEPVETTP